MAIGVSSQYTRKKLGFSRSDWVKLFLTAFTTVSTICGKREDRLLEYLKLVRKNAPVRILL